VVALHQPSSFTNVWQNQAEKGLTEFWGKKGSPSASLNFIVTTLTGIKAVSPSEGRQACLPLPALL